MSVSLMKAFGRIAYDEKMWLGHILSVLSDRFAQNTAASIDALMPLTNVMHQKFEK